MRMTEEERREISIKEFQRLWDQSDFHSEEDPRDLGSD